MQYILRCPSCKKPVMTGWGFISKFIPLERLYPKCVNCNVELKMDIKVIVGFLTICVPMFVVAGYPVEKLIEIISITKQEYRVLLRLLRILLLLLITGATSYVTAVILDKLKMSLYVKRR